MEMEVRFYYSSSEKNKIFNYFKKFKELKYIGRYYEKTDQYDHPIKDLSFYQDKIDGRFRVRKTIGDNYSKCMITWKRRLKSNVKELIHQEEEREVIFNADDYDNLNFLLNDVLHLKLIESYERYRNIFVNDEIEIAIDEYPFGIAIEIENKSSVIDESIIINWINMLGFNINDAYKLSWDDKYEELCNKQNIKKENIVTFDKVMPKITNKFNLY